MTIPDSVLVRYYLAIDSGDDTAALALMSPDVRFAIVMPESTVRGDDRSGIVDYLAGRDGASRRHVPLRVSTVDDVEFVYGAVESGDATLGHFLATVHLTQHAQIDAYQVLFDPELDVLHR